MKLNDIFINMIYPIKYNDIYLTNLFYIIISEKSINYDDFFEVCVNPSIGGNVTLVNILLSTTVKPTIHEKILPTSIGTS